MGQKKRAWKSPAGTGVINGKFIFKHKRISQWQLAVLFFSPVWQGTLILSLVSPQMAQCQVVELPVESSHVFPDVQLRLPLWVEPEIGEVFGDPEALVIGDVKDQMHFVI